MNFDSDWPEEHEPYPNLLNLLTNEPSVIEEFARHSPSRALSADGSTLVVFRRHRAVDDGFSVMNAPPEEGDSWYPCLDIFIKEESLASWSYAVLHPDVMVEGIRGADDHFLFDLTLAGPLADALGLGPSLSVNWSVKTLSEATGLQMLRYDTGLSKEVLLLVLVWMLAEAGVTSAKLEKLRVQADADYDKLQRSLSDQVKSLHSKPVVAPVDDPELAARLEAAIKEHYLVAYQTEIMALATPCIAMVADAQVDASAVGASRLGGLPDLPPDIPWPTQGGEAFSFVAQINLADVPPLVGYPLPDKGLLSFFVGDIDNSDDVEHLTLYLAQLEDLRTVEPPDLEFRSTAIGVFEAAGVRLSLAINLPDYGSDAYFELHFPDSDEHGEPTHRYFELQERLLSPADVRDVSRLCGYPSGEYDPGEPAYFKSIGRTDQRRSSRQRLEASLREWRKKGEKTMIDFVTGELADFDWCEQHQDEIKAGISDWMLLMCLASHSACDMCWWDAGTINFLIRRDDFAKQRFDSTFATITTT